MTTKQRYDTVAEMIRTAVGRVTGDGRTEFTLQEVVDVIIDDDTMFDMVDKRWGDEGGMDAVIRGVGQNLTNIGCRAIARHVPQTDTVWTMRPADPEPTITPDEVAMNGHAEPAAIPATDGAFTALGVDGNGRALYRNEHGTIGYIDWRPL